MSAIIEKLQLTGPNTLEADGKSYPCTIGRGGIAAPGEKREGDLKTPSGVFPLRGCFYRPDRLFQPDTALGALALIPDDLWCDDPAHILYNQHVTAPFDGRHEKLWREDGVYDLIIPLGYNDGPIVPGAGSAIFMHVMREDGVGTEGCIALKLVDLLELLPRLSQQTQVVI